MTPSIVKRSRARKKMSFAWKIVFLSVLGGVSLAVFFLVLALIPQSTSKISRVHVFSWHDFKEMLGLVGLGAVFTGAFGTPVLWAIERNFSHKKLRYVGGSLVAAIGAWFVTIVPIYVLQDFPGRAEQFPLILISLGIYTLLGVVVGTGLSVIVWIYER